MGLRDFFRGLGAPSHRIYAIGDIHGCAKTLDKLLDTIAKDIERHRKSGGTAEIVFMGDYVDRGPDSRAVIDRLLAEQRKQDGVKRTFLKGNHDIEFELYLRADLVRIKHLHFVNMAMNGGLNTFASYNAFLHPEHIATRKPDDTPNASNIRWRVRMAEDIKFQLIENVPSSHIKFLKSLKTSYEVGDLFFCHAGVDIDRPVQDQDIRVLTGMDDALATDIALAPSRRFASYKRGPVDGKVIVTGHNVTSFADVERAKNEHGRIPTDSGAYLGGRLSAVIFDNGKKVDVLSTPLLDQSYDRYAIPSSPVARASLRSVYTPPEFRPVQIAQDNFPERRP